MLMRRPCGDQASTDVQHAFGLPAFRRSSEAPANPSQSTRILKLLHWHQNV